MRKERGRKGETEVDSIQPGHSQSNVGLGVQ